MSKIRGNFKLVAAVIFFSLAVFVLIDLFKSAGRGDAANIGEIAGKEITYQEYDFRTQKMDKNNPNREGSSRAEVQYGVWQQLIQEYVLGKEYSGSGINVPPKEMRSLFLGDRGPMSQTVISRFRDQQGRVDTNQIAQFINIKRKPDLNNEQQVNIANFMIELERDVEAERLSNKLVSLLQGGIYASGNEARRAHDDDYRSANIEFFAVPIASVKDDQVKLTDEALKKFYNEHKERWKTTTKNVKVKYAYVTKIPSSADTAATRKEASDLIDNLGDRKDLLTFALKASDVPFDTNFRSIDMMMGGDYTEAIVKADTSDTVLGPYLTDKYFKLIKVAQTQKMDQSIYKVKHILVKIAGNTAADTAAARAKANELRAKANAGNFAELVSANSADGTTQATGGDIGWINPDTKGPDFYNPIKVGGPGSFVVAKSFEGFHVIQVIAASDKRYQTVEVSKEIVIRDSTEEVLYNRAAIFLAAAMETGSLDSAARKEPRVILQQSGVLDPGSYELQGIKGGRSIISWALRSESNEITPEIKEVDDAYVIAQVMIKTEPGYRSFEDVKDEITPEVMAELKNELILSKLKSISKGDFNAMVGAYGQGALTNKVANVTFNAPSIPYIGMEPYVQGVIFGMKPGETSPILVGKSGVYIVKLETFNEAPVLEPDALKARQGTSADARKRTYIGRVYEAMKELADIDDRRYEFE